MDFSTTLKSAFLCLACVMLSSCSGGYVADMPHWMGGLPPDVPPQPGTPEYDAWMAKRKSTEQPWSAKPVCHFTPS